MAKNGYKITTNSKMAIYNRTYWTSNFSPKICLGGWDHPAKLGLFWFGLVIITLAYPVNFVSRASECRQQEVVGSFPDIILLLLYITSISDRRRNILYGSLQILALCPKNAQGK